MFEKILGSIKIKVPKQIVNQREIKNVFIGTYPPVKCGIATFTKDLTSAVNMLNPDELTKIIAVTPKAQNVKYPWEVTYEVAQEDEKSYLEAARWINKEGFDVVCLQHEYGIFGGRDGEYILHLAKNLRVPLVLTLHTVLETPTPLRKKILQDLCQIAKVVVVMGQVSKTRLIEKYRVDAGKVIVVPHGIPDIPFSSSKTWKDLLGANGKFVIGTFGLLGPSKGYEYLINALPAVFKKHPRAVALIAGETHPKVKAECGEKYRESLIKLAEDLGIKNRVHFLNKYLSLQELIYVIQAMDVYVAPYVNPQQISSGALSYAVGAGRACISTPFAYAQEILKEGRGMIVPFENSSELTKALNSLIENPGEREKVAHSAYLLGRKMTWVKVADSYLDIFRFLKGIYGR